MIIIGTHYAYTAALFDWSSSSGIPTLQKLVGYEGAYWTLWQTFSNHVAGGRVHATIIAYNIIRYVDSGEAIFLVLAFALLVTLTQILKNIHHSPRPFWVNYRGGGDSEEDVEGIASTSCNRQFGNPSGHAIFASYTAMYVYYMIWKKVDEQNEKRDRPSGLK